MAWLSVQFWLALLTFLYVDFLDTTGTLFSMANFLNNFIPGTPLLGVVLFCTFPYAKRRSTLLIIAVSCIQRLYHRLRQAASRLSTTAWDDPVSLMWQSYLGSESTINNHNS